MNPKYENSSATTVLPRGGLDAQAKVALVAFRAAWTPQPSSNVIAFPPKPVPGESPIRAAMRMLAERSPTTYEGVVPEVCPDCGGIRPPMEPR
jgi:hypothetical protein